MIETDRLKTPLEIIINQLRLGLIEIKPAMNEIVTINPKWIAISLRIEKGKEYLFQYIENYYEELWKDEVFYHDETVVFWFSDLNLFSIYCDNLNPKDEFSRQLFKRYLPKTMFNEWIN